MPKIKEILVYLEHRLDDAKEEVITHKRRLDSATEEIEELKAMIEKLKIIR